MIQVIRNKVREEMVFAIVALVALVTGAFVGIRVSAINWHVIALLFVLMGITLVFEKYHLLDYLAYAILSKAHTTRKLYVLLILFTAGLSALITNDVALLTVVPITLSMAKKAHFNPMKIIIAETIAANIGSALTPFGNPQNLYLYTTYKIPVNVFFAITGPLVAFGLVFVLLYGLVGKNQKLDVCVNGLTLDKNPRVYLFLSLFAVVLLGIFRVLPIMYAIVMGTVALIALESKLLLKVDYYLLGTFVCFFIAIDNISRIPFIVTFISGLVNGEMQVFFAALLSSQFISNVPCAVLFSGFTQAFKPLLLGVSVGGLGTLVASLANLISYKLYIKTYPTSDYRKHFYRVNGIGALYLSVVVWGVLL